MKRWLVLGYGLTAYTIAAVVVGYFIGFVANLVVPKSIDSGAVGNQFVAAAVNSALLIVFGLQHSIMARQSFKARWKKYVPEPAERSTYVLASSAALALLCWLWQPMPAVVWHVSSDTLRWLIHGMGALGGLLAIGSTFVIDHFDLMGLRQVIQYWRGQPYSGGPFVTPGPYRLVRHPIMLGLLIAFWATPSASAGRLWLNAGMTAYILIALRFEERDLVREFGETYREYQRNVRMLLPWPKS